MPRNEGIYKVAGNGVGFAAESVDNTADEGFRAAVPLQVNGSLRAVGAAQLGPPNVVVLGASVQCRSNR